MWNDDDFSFKPLPTRFGDVDVTLGRKALFNMGDATIASRTIETQDGELRVQKQGNLVRMVMIAKKKLMSECVPGPLTEVSRTYYAAERIYSTERTLYIDVKRLKTLVVNNGTEDITFCFSSPTTQATATTGKCFVETAFSTRTYHPAELACANSPATTGVSDKGVMYAEFAIKRIASVTFKYQDVPFTYTFAKPASAVQTGTTGVTCANSNSTEKSFASRVITTNKLSKVVMTYVDKALDFALNLIGEGLLGPAEFLKGNLTKFISYDKNRISDLSEILMFGQAWHGLVVQGATNSLSLYSGGTIVYGSSEWYDAHYYKHPTAAAVSNLPAVTALGAEFRDHAYLLNSYNQIAVAGTPESRVTRSWLFAVPGGGSVRIRAPMTAWTTSSVTLSFDQYPEIEYGATLPTPTTINTLEFVHNQGTALGSEIVPSPDGHKALVLLFYNDVFYQCYELTVDEGLAYITAQLVWQTSSAYTDETVVQTASGSFVGTASDFSYTYVGPSGKPGMSTWRSTRSFYQREEIYRQVRKRKTFLNASYTKDGTRVMLKATYYWGDKAAISDPSIVNGSAIYREATWDVIGYEDHIDGWTPTTGGGYTFTTWNNWYWQNAGYTASAGLIAGAQQVRYEIEGVVGFGTITYYVTANVPPGTPYPYVRTSSYLSEIRSLAGGATSAKAATSFVRVGPDAYEGTNATCLKNKGVSLSRANWAYDPADGTIKHGGTCAL